ncbi:MAG: acyltransferase [Ruminococcus sp.]|uniref:DapH/DapD/GlmU-related protein n=1 Tax=Ruminococcus sp. TaxID=41978 RepID=UPI0025CEC483|nr:DapH/DapD/GlmU-related protein [Ruminococcus sp.]MCR5540820.1 acyltransferase [Ruminococcus sp.]
MSIHSLLNKMNIIKRIHLKKIRSNPVEWAKFIGVNMRGDVHIYGRVSWSTEPWIISLGKNVHITDGVRFVTHDGGTLLYRSQVPDLEITKPITVGDNVYIGNCVIILPGVSIGNNCIIGAGAVVSKSIPDNSVAVGVPARVIKTSEEYFNKIKEESLHLGHLKGKEKDDALKHFYGYKGNSKGIYY